MVPRLSKVVCFPAVLSPAEAPCWSSCRCRFRPKGEKAGKMLVPFIHHLHIGEGWQESCQLPLGKSTGCALSLPRPLAVLGHCQWIRKPGLERWGLKVGCLGRSSSLCPLSAPPQQWFSSCANYDGLGCRALPTGALSEGLLLAKAGAVFPQLFFLSNAPKSGTFVTKL